MYRSLWRKDSQPFRSRANSLPGANQPIGPWPIRPWNFRSLAPSFPGPFAPWPFRSLALSLPWTFAPWNLRSLEWNGPGTFVLWNFRAYPGTFVLKSIGSQEHSLPRTFNPCYVHYIDLRYLPWLYSVLCLYSNDILLLMRNCAIKRHTWHKRCSNKW